MSPQSRHDRHYGSRSGATAWIGIAVACAVFSGLYFGGRAIEQKRTADQIAMRQAAAGIKSDLQRYEDQARSGNGGLQPIKPFAIASGQSRDLATVFRNFMTSVINQKIALRNDYLAELKASGWLNAMNPDRIRADPS